MAAKLESGRFYGWTMVPFLMLFPVLIYGIYLVGIGPSVLPLQEEFGWSRTFISAGYATGAILAIFTSPLLGVLIDRWGGRPVLMLGAITLLISCLMVAATDSSGVLWYAGWVIMVAIPATANGYPPLTKIATMWFLRRRGLVMGIIAFSGALCYMMAAVHSFFVVSFGWRSGWITLGVFASIVFVLVTVFVLRERPEDKGWRQDGVPMTPEERAEWARTSGRPATTAATAATRSAEVSMTLGRALRTHVVWLVCIAGAITSMALNIQTTQQVPYLEAMGISKVVAGAVLGVMGLAGAPGRLIGGLLIDRFGKGSIRWLFALAMALEAVGMLILINATSLELVWAFVVVFGIGQGMTVTAPIALFAFYYGPQSFATLYSLYMGMLRIGTAVGPIFAAFIFDTVGSYTIAFTVAMAALLVGAVLVLFCPPPKTAPTAR